MKFEEFEKLVLDFLGYKLSFYYLNDVTKTMHCVLYESFSINLSIGDRYGLFGASIWLGDSRHSMKTVLGKKISLNSDAESIKSSLAIIDNYCRLRLPDKFLVEFDKLEDNYFR